MVGVWNGNQRCHDERGSGWNDGRAWRGLLRTRRKRVEAGRCFPVRPSRTHRLDGQRVLQPCRPRNAGSAFARAVLLLDRRRSTLVGGRQRRRSHGGRGCRRQHRVPSVASSESDGKRVRSGWRSERLSSSHAWTRSHLDDGRNVRDAREPLTRPARGLPCLGGGRIPRIGAGWRLSRSGVPWVPGPRWRGCGAGITARTRPAGAGHVDGDDARARRNPRLVHGAARLRLLRASRLGARNPDLAQAT